MEVWAAYDARQLFPVTSQMILNFAQSAGNNSNQFFYNYFYVVCTCCKFESCTKPSQYSTLWVTRVLNYSFDIGSALWNFTLCTTRGEFSLSWVRWALNSPQSDGENSYLPFSDKCAVSSTFCNFHSCTTHNQYSPLWVTWGLSFSENTWDNISPVLRWHLYFLYILQVSAWSYKEPTSFIMGHRITRFFKGF